MSKKTSIIIFFIILALGAFLRFYMIKEIPPGLYPDEAMNGNNALEALSTGNFKIFYQENNGREGLFINLQAASIWVFGNEPWALRIVSALLGTLTIIGLYLVTKELFKKNQESKVNSQEKIIHNSKFLILDSNVIALLSSVFLATSFWHINFSRIGFRAITVPFFATFGLFFLLKGLRRESILDCVFAGIFIGLGFYGYIAFRFMPFIIAVPIGFYLWKWKQQNKKMQTYGDANAVKTKFCIPCAVLLFLFITFVVALPIGLYFLQNPQDFFGRASNVSIFSAVSPIKEFTKSTVLTVGMFFVWGDCNWRHNIACQPELNPLVALFFLVGFIAAIKMVFQKSQEQYRLQAATVLAWFFFMMFPVILTREGIPHALRAIGIIPPVLILAGLGGYKILQAILQWFEKQKAKWPQKIQQLNRIKREITIVFILILIPVAMAGYKDYFLRWALNINTYYAFSTDIYHIGEFIKTLPIETKKYIIVNLPGVEVRGIPMPAQTVMFLTDTFREEERTKKHVFYRTPDQEFPTIIQGEKAVIVFLDGSDRKLIYSWRHKFPELKIKAPGEFIMLDTE